MADKDKPATLEAEEGPVSVTPDMAATVEGYTTGKWGVYDQYQCTHCPYDTLNQDEILLHVYHKHVRPQPGVPPSNPVPLVDRYGNPVS
jgi:hypothetical protein